MEVEWEIKDTGCVVPVSHKLNQDGYFRKRINGELIMYHRHEWELHNGPIPEGYEINHLCKNRACSNIKHLECIEGSYHAIISNQERYAKRKDLAKKYWLEHKPTGTKLGEIFEVSYSAACRWIREWKNN